MLMVRQEFKATNTPNTTLYRDRLCRNIQSVVFLNSKLSKIQKKIIKKIFNNDLKIVSLF